MNALMEHTNLQLQLGSTSLIHLKLRFLLQGLLFQKSLYVSYHWVQFRKMTSLVFVIVSIFGLGFVPYQCVGKITIVNGGNTSYGVLGENVTIQWKFEQDPAVLFHRVWRFYTEKRVFILAYLVGDGAVGHVRSNLQFEVKKPATLILKNVNDNYNGTYEFEVKLKSGLQETLSVTFSIAAKPTVRINCSTPTIVDEESDVRCLCRGEGGNPPANVTWYKDGKQIGVAGDEQKMLTLSNVDVRYNGTYKCVAQCYTLTAEKSIKVQVRPNFAPVMTSLTFKPEKVIFGQSVTITCKASARPLPTYIIFHNCAEVHNGTKNTYTIQKVKNSDAGLFKCIAKNKLGTSESKYYIMTFEGPFEIATVATATTNGPSIKNSTTEKSDRGTEWYIIFVSLLSGIVIGIIFSYIFVYSRRRFRNGKPQPNPGPEMSTPNSVYQDLDLTKMNSEDNYQSLKVNSGRNEADYENQKYSTYTELNKVRKEENEYQSLT